MPAIVCARCGLKNPGRATRCDCGYELVATQPSQPAGLDAWLSAAAAPMPPPREPPLAEALAPKLRELFRVAGVAPELFDALGTPGRFQLACALPLIEAQEFEAAIKILEEVIGLPASERDSLVAWCRLASGIADALRGQLTLWYVGYDAATRVIEYTGMVDGVALGPVPALQRKLDEIRATTHSGRDGEGRVVDLVRVVFPDAAIARRRLAVLASVGARVFTLDELGELVEVT